MPRYTNEQKAQAVARVVAGEHRRAVARDVGVSDATVRRWLAGAERRATAQEKVFGELADDIAERIRERQEELREALLRRMGDLIPATDDLRAVATAYGILTDKALLAAGKPTRIHGGALDFPPDATPEQLASVADELRRRREAYPARRLRMDG
jgi:transposase-like protein